MGRVEVGDYTHPGGWAAGVDAAAAAREYCRRLEAGGILFFPGAPFDLPDRHRSALLARRQSGLRFHKNISYRPLRDELRGFATDRP
jgi:hypothetical protein